MCVSRKVWQAPREPTSKAIVGIIEAEEADRLIAAGIAEEAREGEIGPAADAEAHAIIEDQALAIEKHLARIAELEAENERLTTELEASAKREADMHQLLTNAGVDEDAIPTAPEAPEDQEPAEGGGGGTVAGVVGGLNPFGKKDKKDKKGK